jgi:hypothetical protein
MKADKVDLAAVLGKPVRYLVPMFQRPYVWRQEEQWEPLWDDIQAVLERQLDDTPLNDALPHFLGAVVLDQVMTPTGMIESRYVIDGQQRLTTLLLFIAAARSLALERGFDGPAQVLEKLLFNDPVLLKSPDHKYKVVPTTFDREAFQQAMAGVTNGAPVSGERVLGAYVYFRGAIREWLKAAESEPDGVARRFEALSTVLWRLLVVVAIDLDRSDNPQIIFETLNARGTPLLAADLIKNNIFQAAVAEGLDIDNLYAQYWRDLDSDWWRADVQQGRLTRPRLDIFMNHWLVMKLGREVVSHLLFTDFKRYLTSRGGSVSGLLAELAAYTSVYRSFEEASQTTAKGRFLYRLNVMETTTAYPVLLWLYGPQGLEDPAELDKSVGVIESWLVRRMLVRATTKNYNAVFLALLKTLSENPSRSSADVGAFFAGLEGDSQYWPGDGDIVASLRVLPAYTSITRARLRMILEAIEEDRRTGKTEPVPIARDLTVEHVMPQEWHQHWPLPPGGDAIVDAAARDMLKQTIGNLTLVTGKLNPAMSNAGWEQKRDALRRHSVLLLSSDVRDAPTWDETRIQTRTEALASSVLHIWPADGIDPKQRPNRVSEDPPAASERPAPELLPRDSTAERFPDPVTIDEPSLLIRIPVLYEPSLSTEELYDCTRGVWKLGDRREGARFALAVIDGVVLEVYAIKRWLPAGTTSYAKRSDISVEGRWEFVGDVAPEAVRSKYKGRSVRSYLPLGFQGPVRYVNC